jgi:hypothetical protein
MPRIGRGYLAGTSFTSVRAPQPGAGMERLALSLCNNISARNDGGGANKWLGHVLDKDGGALTWKAYKDCG